MSCLAGRVSSALIKATVPNVASRAHGSNYTIYAPSRNRAPFWEKVAHGVVMFIGMYSIPVYVLLHIKEYRA